MLGAQRRGFQSAPLTEARGDVVQGVAVSIREARLKAMSVSIRSPHRSKGRLEATWPFHADLFVSIRSPHRSKGRRVNHRAIARDIQFQSAPLTEARGDTAPSRSDPSRQ